VIQLLIKEYPDAANVKDRDGRLPLHLAARSDDASEEVIQLLIEEYPDSVKVKDRYGDLPLHLAARNDHASEEVIQLLIKEYPDAANVKDRDGRLPLTRRETNGTKERVDNVNSTQDKQESSVDESDAVQKLARSKGLLNDKAKGEDLLGVKEEAQAIADAIAMKDLPTPFVVGILGGWGSGKSFTFNLIKEHLKVIQEFDLTNEFLEENFPYVGHVYLIEFDVWTYSKGVLWASLMTRILTVLNDQLSLEEAIGRELLRKGVSVIKLMDHFTTGGEMEYLKKVVQDEKVQKEISEWKPRGENITEALVKATNSKYEKEVEQLEEKKQERLEIMINDKQQLAWEDVIAEANTTFLPIKELLKKAYKQYAKDYKNDPIPQTVEAAMGNYKRWKGKFGTFLRWWDLFWAGKWSPLGLTVFLSSLIIAVVLPLVLDKVGAIATTALGPFISGIFVKFNEAREQFKSAQDVILSRVASELNLDKEQVQRALEALKEKKAQCSSDGNDEENQLDENEEEKKQDEKDEENQHDEIDDTKELVQKASEAANRIQTLNADINDLQDRIWLKEGESLNKVVGDRLGSSNYEEHLGVVHKAQLDLNRISDAMLSNRSKEEERFQRGDPRIVLFIDDLDRCRPEKVVETLEAVQLLVNTELFVVVLAIDAQYVTLCLEKEYVNVLHPERHPSGLDYVEKIVQLPYRVSPISAECMEPYLQGQMNAKKKETSKSSAKKEKTIAEKKVSNQPKRSAPRQPDEKKPPKTMQKKASVAIPTEELEFTWEDLQSLKDACIFSGVGPRSGKRLVNVFKLMKIIWYRRDQTPGVDTPYEVSIKEACVWVLALCASSSKGVREEMCKVFAKIEKSTSMPSCGNLKDFIENSLGKLGADQVDDSPLVLIYDEQCIGIFEKVKWKNDKEWYLVKKDLRLLRSFSFIGE